MSSKKRRIVSFLWLSDLIAATLGPADQGHAWGLSHGLHVLDVEAVFD